MKIIAEKEGVTPHSKKSLSAAISWMLESNGLATIFGKCRVANTDDYPKLHLLLKAQRTCLKTKKWTLKKTSSFNLEV
jgi:hypothetical protein